MQNVVQDWGASPAHRMSITSAEQGKLNMGLSCMQLHCFFGRARARSDTLVADMTVAEASSLHSRLTLPPPCHDVRKRSRLVQATANANALAGHAVRKLSCLCE